MPRGRRTPVVRGDGRRYASIQEAADDVGGDQTNISRACREPGRTAYGFGWRYAGPVPEPSRRTGPLVECRRCACCALDVDGDPWCARERVPVRTIPRGLCSHGVERPKPGALLKKRTRGSLR